MDHRSAKGFTLRFFTQHVIVFLAFGLSCSASLYWRRRDAVLLRIGAVSLSPLTYIPFFFATNQMGVLVFLWILNRCMIFADIDPAGGHGDTQDR